MCDCKRTELKNLNHKTGFAEKFCMDCGKNLGEIPASYNAVMDYCTSRKLATPPKRNMEWETQPMFIQNLKRQT